MQSPVSWLAMVGFMGTGKSRIGWELARALSLNFIDTDKVIEKITGLKIAEIFETSGEPTFRRYESEVVERVVRLDNVLVSCGGGMFVNALNRQRLMARGPVVCLSASPETVYERTRHSPRVLLQVPDPISKIRELMQARQPAYAEAPIQISTDGSRPRDGVIEEIVSRLNDWSLQHPQPQQETGELDA